MISKVLMYGKLKDKEGMTSSLKEFVTNFTRQHQSRSVEKNWTEFKEGLRKVILKYIPEKIIREKHHLPWISQSIKQLLRRKKRRYNKAKRTKKAKHWEDYRKIQQEYRNTVKIAHEKYLQDLFEDDKGKPNKKFWRMIKARRKDDIGIPALRDRNGKTVTNAKDKAQALSEQYKKVFTTEDLNNIPSINHQHPGMKDINITEKGVTSLLKKLNIKKAIGPDLISTRILKDYAEIIAPALTKTFQQTLDKGEIPQDWKMANVIAIYKKSDKQDPANYRPVSLTSVICKCLEHIIFSEVMTHLDKHNILVDNQHGFRSKRSTETQLITTVNDFTESLNRKGHLDVLILDFSKAFDTVAHTRLLRKLEAFGIRGKTHQWIKKWLTERTQTVVLNGEYSSAERVGSGVPQGTVLGPLMFLLFINDIGDNVKESTLRLFADDCLLYREIKTDIDQNSLQQDLNSMMDWAKKWQMQFNATKCYHLRITNKKKPTATQYTMSNHLMERVEHNPYLGVELSSNHSWGNHIDNVTQKAHRSLNFLRRNLGKCSKTTKEMAYKSLVQPHLQYASSAWDPHQANHIRKIERVQAKAARFVLGRYGQCDSVSEMRKELGWHTQQAQRFVNRMTILYKTINGHIALSIPPTFIPNNRISRGQHQHQFIIPSIHIDSYKYSYFPRTIRCWNILPSYIIESKDPDSFKTSLHKALNSNEIYVVPPRDIFNRPRLGSGSCSQPGAVY